VVLILTVIQYRKKIKVSDIVLKLGQGITWSEEQKQIKKDILNGNYIETYPLLSVDNVCLDGHHRVMALKELEPERVIVVKKTLFKWSFIRNILSKNGVI
jgi:hypothetical protein